MFTYIQVLGFSTPVILIALIYRGQWTFALIVFSMLAYPYVFDIQKWDLWIKFGFYGTRYFEGGVSTSFEKPINSDYPLLICYHPHGMFCLGPYFNGGRAALALMKDRSRKDKQYFWGDVIGKNDKIMERLYGKALIDPKLLYAPIFKLVSTGWLHGFASASKGALLKF